MLRLNKCFRFFRFFSSVFVIVLFSYSACADWELQESGTTETLNDVCFIDEMNGWAVGDNSTLIRTTDGGRTWERLDYPEEEYSFNCVEFINATTGYMIGDDYDAENPTYTYKVLFTRDGGISWENRTPTNTNEAVYQRFFDIDVLDEKTCWLTAEVGSRGRILHTTDGGKTWETNYIDQHLTRRQFNGIDFIDENTGWALCADYTDIYGTTWCFVTENGGDDWTEVDMNSRLDQRKIYAVNENVVWVCNFRVQVSRDGGYNWSPGQEEYVGGMVRDIYPLDEMRAYVLMSDSLMYTDDGGKSFETLFVHGIEERLNPFYAIAGINGSQVWCANQKGEIIKYTAETTSVAKTKPFLHHPVVTLSPNPFNSSTSISFDLEKRDSVEITVYDIIGRKVETLVNENLLPGSHTYQWNGRSLSNNSSVSSGVYFAVLKTSRYMVTQKMLLLR